MLTRKILGRWICTLSTGGSAAGVGNRYNGGEVPGGGQELCLDFLGGTTAYTGQEYLALQWGQGKGSGLSLLGGLGCPQGRCLAKTLAPPGGYERCMLQAPGWVLTGGSLGALWLTMGRQCLEALRVVMRYKEGQEGTLLNAL